MGLLFFLFVILALAANFAGRTLKGGLGVLFAMAAYAFGALAFMFAVVWIGF